MDKKATSGITSDYGSIEVVNSSYRVANKIPVSAISPAYSKRPTIAILMKTVEPQAI